MYGEEQILESKDAASNSPRMEIIHNELEDPIHCAGFRLENPEITLLPNSPMNQNSDGAEIPPKKLGRHLPGRDPPVLFSWAPSSWPKKLGHHPPFFSTQEGCVGARKVCFRPAVQTEPELLSETAVDEQVFISNSTLKTRGIMGPAFADQIVCGETVLVNDKPHEEFALYRRLRFPNWLGTGEANRSAEE